MFYDWFMKTINLPTHSPHRPLLRCGLLLMPLVLGCFALSPQALAVCEQGCLINNNTVLGDSALISNTGTSNTAMGFAALHNNTTASGNTATGEFALYSNTIGDKNTANGAGALFYNTRGVFNTANGYKALLTNDVGHFNTATGTYALSVNTRGTDNTATGSEALRRNSNGSSNTANGSSALYSNRTGDSNTALGDNSLGSNTNGSNNIALGASAGSALTDGSNNIDIGNLGVASESNTIRIGTSGTQTATFIAGISGATVPTGVAVIVDSSGHLGTTTSSARYKEAIKPMGKESEGILSLKPVTFQYKKQLDPQRITQFGLVAEDVEKVNPDLVARDERGKPYTVRYEAVNAMLLNEFIKEHRKVEEQGTTIAKQGAIIQQQQKEIAALTTSLKEQAAQIQKVSDQLQLRKASAAAHREQLATAEVEQRQSGSNLQ
jgi:hypothetical protein